MSTKPKLDIDNPTDLLTNRCERELTTPKIQLKENSILYYYTIKNKKQKFTFYTKLLIKSLAKAS